MSFRASRRIQGALQHTQRNKINMKTICCFILLCVMASGMAYEIITDGEQEYLLVPLDTTEYQVSSRTKRQTNFNFDTMSGRGTLRHTGTLLNNNNHHLSGTGSVSKGLPKGPWGMGGNLDYTHKPSGSSLSAGAQNLRGFGTDVGVTGRYNFVNKPNTQAYVQGQYGRHFGGPFGTGRPNYGVGIGLTHRF